MNNVTETLNALTSGSLIFDERADYLDLLLLHRSNPQRYPYLLESAAQSEQNSRFDILFAYPQECMTLGAADLADMDFLNQFDERWKKSRTVQANHDLPFTGGWFVYLSYEFAQQIEPSLLLASTASINFPVAFATRIPAAIILDHHKHCSYLVAEKSFAHLLPMMSDDLESAMVALEEGASVTTVKIDEIIEDAPQAYLDGVARIKEYILAGDTFQVNLSRAWRAKVEEGTSGGALYKQLRQANPSPFAGLIFHDGQYIISSSPERLVKVNQTYVEVRPIAGTRPRALEQGDDKALSESLLKHPKEIAEHIMLIDLERNDLGRICQPGSVEVNELMCLESYRHVHHIVSNVRGKLKAEITPGEVISAVFPGGTITGCPKVRCMEIIHELEQEPRGAYTGAMGYVNNDGTMDLNILIRTLSLINNQITIRAGAGIVADSDPAMELEESRTKARGLLRAIQNDLD